MGDQRMNSPRRMLPPPRSPFQPPISPPPSASVLKLQKLGLELGPSASKSSLHIPSYNSSVCTTPSDLDKPLPLEPREIRRRTSSIYSNETTISDIIDMYGGLLDDDSGGASDIDPKSYRDTVAPVATQAYRDTIAPGMARRLSLTHSTWVPPIVPHKLRTSVSSPTMRARAAELSPTISTADSKNAPSFVEFSRNLQQRRNDMVSPFSTDSYEQHRQEALEKLAPPSPQDSTEALNVAYEQPQSFLPGPMSGTITDVVATEYVPEPLDLSRTSRVLLLPQEAARHAQEERLEYTTQHQFQQPDTNQSWARVMEKLNKRESAEQREKERVLNTASQKYPGMKSPRHTRKDSSRSSGGSSITQHASNTMQVLSGSSSKYPKTPGSTSATTPHRQKQLAVKVTPYQEHGPDIWLPPEKQEKKMKWEEKKLQKEWDAEQNRKHQRNRSSANSKTSMGSAYQSGQNQIVGIMQRLSRSASEKRRDKLKKNIVHVGPTKTTKEKEKACEGAGGWK